MTSIPGLEAAQLTYDRDNGAPKIARRHFEADFDFEDCCCQFKGELGYTVSPDAGDRVAIDIDFVCVHEAIVWLDKQGFEIKDNHGESAACRLEHYVRIHCADQLREAAAKHWRENSFGDDR